MHSSEIIQAWGKILKGEQPCPFDRDYAGVPFALPGMLRV